MAAPRRRATYEDLMQVPDTKVAEIIDGELIVSPRPASPHAYAASAMGATLLSQFHGDAPGAADPARPGGWWMLFEPELHLGGDVVVPDWAGWRQERMPVFPAVPFFTQAPDWVCEIISPSHAGDESVRIEPFADVELALRRWWVPAPRSESGL